MACSLLQIALNLMPAIRVPYFVSDLTVVLVIRSVNFFGLSRGSGIRSSGNFHGWTSKIELFYCGCPSLIWIARLFQKRNMKNLLDFGLWMTSYLIRLFFFDPLICVVLVDCISHYWNELVSSFIISQSPAECCTPILAVLLLRTNTNLPTWASELNLSLPQSMFWKVIRFRA